MRIAVAQIDPVVGAYEANVKKIKEAYQRACSKQARLLLTPELGICGYPPHDLVEQPEIFERCEKAIEELRLATVGKKCALIVGHVIRNPHEYGRIAQNVVTVLEDGKRVFRQAKSLLPTYDVFDESRYFEPAHDIKLWNCDGKNVALGICEDLWAGDTAFGRPLYKVSPAECYHKENASLVLAIAASPYETEKWSRRESLHAEVAKNVGAPLVYVNQVGATDEVLFDGGSFAMDAKGKLAGRLPFFKNSFGILEIIDGAVNWESPQEDAREDHPPVEMDIIQRALIVGIRDYFARTGFKSALIGLSGGIDSAVVATLAVQALGPANVFGVAMPSQFSSGHSLEDAEKLARNLGIRLQNQPIKFMYSTMSRELTQGIGAKELAPLALENLQSRLRGVILMTLSNHLGALVLTTGNKSEMATGYCTLYGDMCGALAPIGDLYKTQVYELARHLNAKLGGVIPESSITKAPSAELKPNQTDQDSLPPYEKLDPMLKSYLEEREPEERIAKNSGAWATDIIRKVNISEYKRRQAAPVLKVSSKAFGIGRRMPIAKTF